MLHITINMCSIRLGVRQRQLTIDPILGPLKVPPLMPYLIANQLKYSDSI